MPDKILFKNNKLLVQTWNADVQQYETEKLEPGSLSWCYNDEVIFDEDLTIEGFMKALEPYFELIDEHFASYSRGFKCRHYYEQMLKPAGDDSEDDEITHIEFYWSCELQEFGNYIGGTPESNLEIYSSFHGKGKDETNYSFSMSPINNWKHYKFKLNPSIKCIKFEQDKEKGIAKWTTLFESTKVFTLHDILKSFFFEITFYGYTETIIEVADKLSQISDNIIDSGMSGKDFADMEIDLLKKDLKEAEESDDFESAIKIRDRIQLLEARKNND